MAHNFIGKTFSTLFPPFPNAITPEIALSIVTHNQATATPTVTKKPTVLMSASGEIPEPTTSQDQFYPTAKQTLAPQEPKQSTKPSFLNLLNDEISQTRKEYSESLTAIQTHLKNKAPLGVSKRIFVDWIASAYFLFTVAEVTTEFSLLAPMVTAGIDYTEALLGEADLEPLSLPTSWQVTKAAIGASVIAGALTMLNGSPPVFGQLSRASFRYLEEHNYISKDKEWTGKIFPWEFLWGGIVGMSIERYHGNPEISGTHWRNIPTFKGPQSLSMADYYTMRNDFTLNLFLIPIMATALEKVDWSELVNPAVALAHDPSLASLSALLGTDTSEMLFASLVHGAVACLGSSQITRIWKNEGHWELKENNSGELDINFIKKEWKVISIRSAFFMSLGMVGLLAASSSVTLPMAVGVQTLLGLGLGTMLTNMKSIEKPEIPLKMTEKLKPASLSKAPLVSDPQTP